MVKRPAVGHICRRTDNRLLEWRPRTGKRSVGHLPAHWTDDLISKVPIGRRQWLWGKLKAECSGAAWESLCPVVDDYDYHDDDNTTVSMVAILVTLLENDSKRSACAENIPLKRVKSFFCIEHCPSFNIVANRLGNNIPRNVINYIPLPFYTISYIIDLFNPCILLMFYWSLQTLRNLWIGSVTFGKYTSNVRLL